jgi:hypothetical protein
MCSIHRIRSPAAGGFGEYGRGRGVLTSFLDHQRHLIVVTKPYRPAREVY